MKSAFVLSLCLFPMGCTSPQQVTVEEIHSALSGYYGSIHSLRCEYVETLSDGTDTRYEWLQQGQMFRYAQYEHTSDVISQVFVVNEKQGNRLVFHEGGPGQCEIRSDFEQESYHWDIPVDVLGMRIRCVPGTSLADLTKLGSCSIEGYDKIAGVRCVHVRFLPIYANPLKPVPVVIDAFLDPEHNFLPRRLELCYGENESAILNRWEVFEYCRLKDALTGGDRWFPKFAVLSGGPKNIKIPIAGGGIRFSMREVELNKLVPRETFDPQIPHGTRVIDVERNRKYVQGGESAVAEQVRTLTREGSDNSTDESQEKRSTAIQAYPPRSFSSVAYCAAIVSLCCLGLAFWKRVRSG